MGGPVRDWTMWSTGPGSRHPRADPRHLDAHCCPLQPARLVLLPAREDQGGEGPLETGRSGPLRAPPDCAHMLTPPAGRSLLPLQPAGWFSSPAPEEGGGEGP